MRLKINSGSFVRQLPAMSVIILVAVVGSSLVLLSRAESPGASVEAATGTVGTTASVQSDSLAKNGQYVEFGTPASVQTMTANLRLLNYFPSQHGWADMWTDFDPTEINGDFATMSTLGANTVRIIVPANTFGYPTPTSQMEQELAQVVSMAAANHLRVQLTLFDWWSDWTDFSGSDAWSTALLTPYHNDADIAFVELKNEINPYESDQVAWMQHELPVVKQIIGTVPLTISVTNLSDASGDPETVAQEFATFLPEVAATPLDLYDVHYYDYSGNAYSELQQIKQAAGSEPIIIGETGISSWDGNTASGTAQEATQDENIRQVAWAAQTLGYPPIAPWIFQDFTAGEVGGEAAGTLNSQNFYGLLRTDGSWKPVASSIQSLFKNGTVSADTNGAFTNAYDGQPLEWSIQDGSQGTLAWDGTTGHDAAGSVELSNTSGGASAEPNYQIVPVVNLTSTNRTVTMTAWAKGLNTTGDNNLGLAWFGANQNYISNVTSTSLPSGTTGWTQLSVTATAPSGADYVQLDVSSSFNSGSVWFDDVSSTIN